MKLEIKDFAKIEYAEINIDGITVIAGENNTGKSTVGKILFSVFNATSNIERKIELQRSKEIEENCNLIIRNYLANNNISLKSSRILLRRLSDKISESTDIYNDLNHLKYLISSYLKNTFKDMDIDNNSIDMDIVDSLANRISAILSLPDERVRKEVISRYFNTIFNNQINSLTKRANNASIELTIKSKIMNIEFKDNDCIEFETDFGIIHNAFYIDNPFIIDEISSYYFPHTNEIEESLKRALSGSSLNVMDDLFESVIAKDKLDDIYGVLEKVIEGKIIETSGEDFYLEANGFEKPIHFNNLSTGLKSFTILKMLLENGALKEKDVLILDEPEIHLHPEWQIIYAELIVLLQKYFDLSIVITTHSPYFLDALNLFSVKYGIGQKINYYISTQSGNRVKLSDVTKNIDSIYEKMSSPIKILETLRYELNNN